jgi:hypothetical protein
LWGPGGPTFAAFLQEACRGAQAGQTHSAPRSSKAYHY